MQAAGVVVRRATEHDVPALLAMLRRYFAEGEVQHTETERTLLGQVCVPILGFYVAQTTQGLGGCIMCRPLGLAGRAAECKRLYVPPELRGGGIATLLMDAIESAADAAGFGWMYLDSKDGFRAAMAMYRQRGYVECPRYNDNPEAAFFFRKRLR